MRIDLANIKCIIVGINFIDTIIDLFLHLHPYFNSPHSSFRSIAPSHLPVGFPPSRRRHPTPPASRPPQGGHRRRCGGGRSIKRRASVFSTRVAITVTPCAPSSASHSARHRRVPGQRHRSRPRSSSTRSSHRPSSRPRAQELTKSPALDRRLASLQLER
jgi:hypothetical protein